MSRIFKSYQSTSPSEEKKTITIKPIVNPFPQQSDDGLTNEHVEHLVQEAKIKAKQMLDNAHKEAEKIKNNILEEKSTWEEEKQQLIKEAQKQGFDAGRQEGITQGYSEVKSAITEAQNVILTAKEHYDDKIVAAEGVILQLSLKVAEKIIGTTLAEDNQLFTSLVKTVLKEVREDEDIQIHVHPQYYELIVNQKDEFLNIFPKETSLYIFPNDELNETDCFIETENGRIDASVDSQLAEIKKKLFELLESGTK